MKKRSLLCMTTAILILLSGCSSVGKMLMQKRKLLEKKGLIVPPLAMNEPVYYKPTVNFNTGQAANSAISSGTANATTATQGAALGLVGALITESIAVARQEAFEEENAAYLPAINDNPPDIKQVKTQIEQALLDTLACSEFYSRLVRPESSTVLRTRLWAIRLVNTAE